MPTNTIGVKLNDGKKAQVAKTDDRYIFVNTTLTWWQLGLLIFILVFSILAVVIEMNLILEGFNRLLYEFQAIKQFYQIGGARQIGNFTIVP